jgi:peptide/nickel transport system substrate-binding protein
VTEVEQGRADAIPQNDHIPTDRLPELSSKFPDQVHISPIFGTWYMALNTRIPPFNNLQARQAVNYATDRNALVKIYGGPKLATPTCQVLPPEFPGYKPYCPYTTNPGSGKWTGPDMAKAKQLVKASGTAGATVKVNSDNDPTDRAYAVYFRDLLNSLGYKAKLQILASSIQYPYVQNSKHKVEMAFSDWFADYPGPSDFLDILLGCDSFHPNSNASPNIAEFCNRSIQSQMTRSLAQAATAPAAANRSWAKVDQTMTDQAPWVSMFNPKYLDFVSKRVKNYQFSPQWYFLIDQASIK